MSPNPPLAALHSPGLYEPPTEAELQSTLRRRGWNRDTPGTLWNGPPLIKLHVRGCPRDEQCVYRGCVAWKGVRINTPRPTGDATLANGALVHVEVGDPWGGGEVETRDLVVGVGFPIFLATGAYGNSSVNTTTIVRRVVPASPPIRFTWCDSDVIAGNGAWLLQAPAVVAPGALAAQPVPDGAVQCWSSAACKITWTDQSHVGGGGAAHALVEAVVAGQPVTVKGHDLATNVATTLRFFLAPL